MSESVDSLNQVKNIFLIDFLIVDFFNLFPKLYLGQIEMTAKQLNHLTREAVIIGLNGEKNRVIPQVDMMQVIFFQILHC
jgi:hypothetical protein